ncbi:MAG: hypothetical protein IJ746_00485 [Ruminococcus sp.]|nr:hypothetical protein [Ruminococcus sp.]
MRNPNRPIADIDDRPKSREEIAEMIERMLKTDEDGNPEKTDKKETA